MVVLNKNSLEEKNYKRVHQNYLYSSPKVNNLFKDMICN